MKALILDGTSSGGAAESGVHGLLCEVLRAKGWEAETKHLSTMRIAPCRGCFNCWLRTPGECMIADEGRDVARDIVNSDALIFFSPVTFGGYSSCLKHAADRMIPTISPLFKWVRGEMHHRQRYPAHSFLAVGWQNEPDADGAAVFSRLAVRNAINMHAPSSGSAVLHGKQSPEEWRAQVSQLVAKLEASK